MLLLQLSSLQRLWAYQIVFNSEMMKHHNVAYSVAFFSWKKSLAYNFFALIPWENHWHKQLMIFSQLEFWTSYERAEPEMSSYLTISQIYPVAVAFASKCQKPYHGIWQFDAGFFLHSLELLFTFDLVEIFKFQMWYWICDDNFIFFLWFLNAMAINHLKCNQEAIFFWNQLSPNLTAWII